MKRTLFPRFTRAALIAFSLFAATLPAQASVYFQNTGTVSGWSNGTQDPLPGDNKGTSSTVNSPTYKGSTAIKFNQIYDPDYSARTNYTGGYHAEVVKFNAAAVGQDRYFGQTLYLPSTWMFHDTNDTFQQFSPEDPSGPWALNWIQNDHLWIRVNGHQDLGTITRGVWTRVVARFKLGNPGNFEYWVNGTKKNSQINANIDPNGSQTIRWSVGIYCTAWRNHIPPDGDIFNQTTRTLYQDHFRIASSYNEADPDQWNEAGSTFNGNYRIMARHSGKAVVVEGASTADGANVFQWTYGGSNTNDEWTITELGGGYQKIINRNSGKALVVESASTADGADVIQWTYGGSNTNDEWKIESVGGGYYRIINRNSGKVLDVSGSSTADGADVVQWSWNGGNNQQFQVLSVP